MSRVDRGLLYFIVVVWIRYLIFVNFSKIGLKIYFENVMGLGLCSVRFMVSVS